MLFIVSISHVRTAHTGFYETEESPDSALEIYLTMIQM